MLTKFREEREKRKMAPPTSTPAALGVTGTAVAGTPSRSGERGVDFRSSRGSEEYRDRDRGYDRHSSSRYESVALPTTCQKSTMLTFFFPLVTDVEIGNVREALEEGDIRLMSQQRTYYVI